jgi:hypothetical protein
LTNKDKIMNSSDIHDLVVVEEFVIAKKPVPEGKSYVIRIDADKYTVHKHKLSGTEILALAAKTTSEWKLYLHRPGRPPERVAPDQEVNLREHQVTHFSTIAIDATEGSRGRPCR